MSANWRRMTAANAHEATELTAVPITGIALTSTPKPTQRTRVMMVSRSKSSIAAAPREPIPATV
jgi:hypothetical protein